MEEYLFIQMLDWSISAQRSALLETGGGKMNLDAVQTE